MTSSTNWRKASINSTTTANLFHGDNSNIQHSQEEDVVGMNYKNVSTDNGIIFRHSSTTEQGNAIGSGNRNGNRNGNMNDSKTSTMNDPESKRRNMGSGFIQNSVRLVTTKYYFCFSWVVAWFFPERKAQPQRCSRLRDFQQHQQLRRRSQQRQNQPNQPNQPQRHSHRRATAVRLLIGILAMCIMSLQLYCFIVFAVVPFFQNDNYSHVRIGSRSYYRNHRIEEELLETAPQAEMPDKADKSATSNTTSSPTAALSDLLGELNTTKTIVPLEGFDDDDTYVEEENRFGPISGTIIDEYDFCVSQYIPEIYQSTTKSTDDNGSGEGKDDDDSNNSESSHNAMDFATSENSNAINNKQESTMTSTDDSNQRTISNNSTFRRTTRMRHYKKMSISFQTVRYCFVPVIRRILRSTASFFSFRTILSRDNQDETSFLYYEYLATKREFEQYIELREQNHQRLKARQDHEMRHQERQRRRQQERHELRQQLQLTNQTINEMQDSLPRRNDRTRRQIDPMKTTVSYVLLRPGGYIPFCSLLQDQGVTKRQLQDNSNTNNVFNNDSSPQTTLFSMDDYCARYHYNFQPYDDYSNQSTPISPNNYKTAANNTHQLQQAETLHHQPPTESGGIDMSTAFQNRPLLIVGGTDGSGTRAFVEMLRSELGVNMILENRWTMDVEAGMLFNDSHDQNNGTGWPPLASLILNYTHTANYDPIRDLPQHIYNIAMKEMNKFKQWYDRIALQQPKNIFVQNFHNDLPVSSTEQQQQQQQNTGRRKPPRNDALGVSYGFKAPISMLLLPLFRELYGSVKYIHVVRDGRDICFSSNMSPVRKFYDVSYQPDIAQQKRRSAARVFDQLTNDTHTGGDSTMDFNMDFDRFRQRHHRYRSVRFDPYRTHTEINEMNIMAMDLWNDWNTQVYDYLRSQGTPTHKDVSTSSQPSLDYVIVRSEDLLNGPDTKFAIATKLANFVGAKHNLNDLCRYALVQGTRDLGASPGRDRRSFHELREMRHLPHRFLLKENEQNEQNKSKDFVIFADPSNTLMTTTALNSDDSNTNATVGDASDVQYNFNIVQKTTADETKSEKIASQQQRNRRKLLALSFQEQEYPASLVTARQQRAAEREEQLSQLSQQQDQQSPLPPSKSQSKMRSSRIQQRYGKWQTLVQPGTPVYEELHRRGRRGLELFGYYPPRKIEADLHYSSFATICQTYIQQQQQQQQQ